MAAYATYEPPPPPTDAKVADAAPVPVLSPSPAPPSPPPYSLEFTHRQQQWLKNDPSWETYPHVHWHMRRGQARDYLLRHQVPVDHYILRWSSNKACMVGSYLNQYKDICSTCIWQTENGTYTVDTADAHTYPVKSVADIHNVFALYDKKHFTPV